MMAIQVQVIQKDPGTDRKERTLIVVCEFTGKRYRTPLSVSARLAKDACIAIKGRDLSPEGHLSEAIHDSYASDRIAPQASECRELAESAGANVLDVITQRRDHPDPATLVGKGKLAEIASQALSERADLIIFEQDLSPTQLRELERSLPCRVIDRTQLILDIFASHARTREGQLQVELAQLEYMLPRLAGRGRSMSQLGGGIGTRGPGETQIETDRRKIGRRIHTVRTRLDGVRNIRRQQRQRRISAPVLTVALIGYTNAGKSTLFNALTQSGVLESPRLFATLDPKLHSLTLPSRRQVLLSDTVGFIRALPPSLVKAFRATLEEVQNAEVLIHVMDASSSSLDVHRDAVETVLRELEVENKPRIEVLNKIDLLSPDEPVARAGPITLSARNRTGLEELLTALDAALQLDPLEEREMIVPQCEGGILAALDAGVLVRAKTFCGQEVHLRVQGPASVLRKFRNYWQVERELSLENTAI